jgi:hypothetical protein
MKRDKRISDPDQLYSLIDGRDVCDAHFYGRWLCLAAQAEGHWRELMSDKRFSKRIMRLTCAFIPDFGIGSTAILSALLRDGAPCAVNLWDETGEEFVMLAGMGFFREKSGHYRLEIPSVLTRKTVKAAALAFAETEDKRYVLHPESLVVTASSVGASSWV